MYYELKKMMSFKIMILWIIFMLTVSVIYPVYYTYNYRKVNMKIYENVEEEYKNVWDVYQGRGMANFIFNKADQMTNDTFIHDNLEYFANPYHDYAAHYLNTKSYRETGIKYVVRSYASMGEMDSHSYEELDKEIKELELNLDTDTYRYKNLIKEKKMMERVELKFVYNHFWVKFDVTEVIAVFCVYVFMIFIFSGTYAKEYHSNMNYILYTGKKSMSKLMVSKWGAACLFGAGNIFLINIGMLLAFIVYGSSSGYNVDIVNMGMHWAFTPFKLTIAEFIIVKFLYQLIGMVVLILFIEFVSLRKKDASKAILYGSLLFIPHFFLYLGVVGSDYVKIIDLLYDCSLLATVFPQYVFYKYHSINLFGNPVLYVVIYPICLLIISAVLGFLTYRELKNLEINLS